MLDLGFPQGPERRPPRVSGRSGPAGSPPPFETQREPASRPGSRVFHTLLDDPNHERWPGRLRPRGPLPDSSISSAAVVAEVGEADDRGVAMAGNGQVEV